MLFVVFVVLVEIFIVFVVVYNVGVVFIVFCICCTCNCCICFAVVLDHNNVVVDVAAVFAVVVVFSWLLYRFCCWYCCGFCEYILRCLFYVASIKLKDRPSSVFSIGRFDCSLV